MLFFVSVNLNINSTAQKNPKFTDNIIICSASILKCEFIFFNSKEAAS